LQIRRIYATYVLFGFLDYWYKTFNLPVDDSYVENLLKQGFISINTNDFTKKAREILARACTEYSSKLAGVYAAQKKLFENSEFKILNVEFIRNLESLSRSNSFIAENHKEILNDFSNIIGGEYRECHEFCVNS